MTEVTISVFKNLLLHKLPGKDGSWVVSGERSKTGVEEVDTPFWKVRQMQGGYRSDGDLEKVLVFGWKRFQLKGRSQRSGRDRGKRSNW